MTGKYGGTPDGDIQVRVTQRELDQLQRYKSALDQALAEELVTEDDLEDYGLTAEDIEEL